MTTKVRSSPSLKAPGFLCALAALALAAGGSTAYAASFNLGGAENYALLFQGGGNNTLQITNVTVNGNIGVGHTGLATVSGPSTISGNVSFSAANTGQFSSNNASNSFNGGVGPQGTAYQASFNSSPVSTSLSWVNSLSQTLLGDAGSSVSITGTQTISASAGTLYTVNGQSVRVFDATSFNNNGGQTLTINGTANDLVAINLDGLGNIQFHGGINFTGGIGSDNVIFNLGGGDYSALTGAASLDINNNGGTAGVARGIFLDPNGAISVTNAVVYGRVFGGDSHDFQYVSGARITAPIPTVPDAGSSLLLISIAVGLLAAAKRTVLA